MNYTKDEIKQINDFLAKSAKEIWKSILKEKIITVEEDGGVSSKRL